MNQKQISAKAILATGILFSACSFVFAGPVPAGLNEDVGRRALQGKMEGQGRGQISLTHFAVTEQMPPEAVFEVRGEKIYPLRFFARVAVSGPCKWFYRVDGLPLTFNTYSPAATNMPPDKNFFEVAAAGDSFAIHGVELFSRTNADWQLVGFVSEALPLRASDESSIRCVNYLKQIGLAFRLWAGDNNDSFPFNVSTNSGGTKELCRVVENGLDINAAAHFQVLSNELNEVKILVCPNDTKKSPARDFASLQAQNISYLVYPGADADEKHPRNVLARCTIHNHVLFCDGSVQFGDAKK